MTIEYDEDLVEAMPASEFIDFIENIQKEVLKENKHSQQKNGYFVLNRDRQFLVIGKNGIDADFNSEELENPYMKFTDVSDACVEPMYDERWDDIVRAFNHTGYFFSRSDAEEYSYE